MNSDGRRRRGGLLLLVLPAVALVFWLTAVGASSLPGRFVVAVNVHGLTLNPVGPGTNQRPAPLSLSVLADAQQDSTVPSASPGTGSRPNVPATTAAPSARPTSAPTATPTPLPTLLPTPSLTPLPTPSLTPSPAGSATISGQVLDSQTKLPVVGATVFASPGAGSTLTDANGNYSLGVAPGSYTVTASAVGYVSASQSVTLKAAQRLTVNFKLTSGTTFGSLTGTVTDSVSGAPIVGATVALSDGMVRVTDNNGAFSYSIVLSGSYTLTVSAAGYVTQSQPVTIRAGKTTNVQVVLVHT